MKYKEEIVKRLNKLAGGYSIYVVFEDWIEMYAISIASMIDIRMAEQREKRYLEVAHKYSKEQLQEMTEIAGMLVMACEEKMEDVLGWIYMHLEISSNKIGQFFTPYHISQMLAKLAGEPKRDSEGRYLVNEPSCGAGGNIIAFAERMKEEGINYQTDILVTCQDLDWKAIYMCYVQMSLYGIPAKVIQGDTLSGKVDSKNIFVTPQWMMIKATIF